MTDEPNNAQLETAREVWNERAALWNERNLQNWGTNETATWWQGWLDELRPYLPAPNPDKLLLDAGCGNGQLSTLYAQLGYTVRGCDLSPNMVQFAIENSARAGLTAPQVEFVEASIDRLPYPDATFDVVNCRCVLDFTPQPGYALRELRRVTKLGGTLILQVMGAASPIKTRPRPRWLHYLRGLDPTADSYRRMGTDILPWEVEQILPILGWQLQHQNAFFGPAANGATNPFTDEQMRHMPTVLRQAAATAVLFVCQAIDPTPYQDND